MIPISRDQKVFKEIDGVVYSFLPPVGSLEFDLIFDQSSEDIVDTSKYYDDAVKILKESGKKRPTEKQITKQIMIMMPRKEGAGKKQAKEMDDFFNRVCTDWKSDIHTLPEFKQGDCAGDMGYSLKRQLYEWYWGLINLGEKEAKN
jgi:hypothetical protein